MSSEKQPMRRRLIYEGRVQGVGFRQTTVSIARRFPVAGYVKNLPDGTVELAVEGESGTVEAFLDEISAAFQGLIDDCRSEAVDADEVFRGFEIRYK